MTDEKANNPTEEMEIYRAFKCPQCGTEEPLFEGLVNEEKEAGRYPKEEMPGYKTETLPIHSQKVEPKVGEQVMLAVVVRDICGKCGKEYVIRVRRKLVPVVMRNPQVTKPLYVPGNGQRLNFPKVRG
jgi:DNA-directed RNA polymerase subunit M/transcription elongation factor TFIIS